MGSEESKVECVLAKLGIAGPNSRIDIRQKSRAMSHFWEVRVSTNGATADYIVKRAGGDQKRQAFVTDRQARLLRSIGESTSDAQFDDLYIGHCDDLLVLKGSPLPCLAQMISSFSVIQMIKGYTELRQSVRLAGEWLRRWHDSTETKGDIAKSLALYLEGRERILSLLPADIQKRLVTCAASCPSGTIVNTHSDFTPFNILTNGRRMAVIDAGIWEWESMSPAWDVCTFLVSLEERAMQQWPKPIGLFTSLYASFNQQFLRAYGADDLQSTKAYHICLAIRHMITFGKHQGANANMATYALEGLQESLEACDAC